MNVRRLDFCGSTSQFETTSQGFLKVKARLTRTGIFSYKQDGKTVRELRLDGEVFSSSALKSVSGAPVTDLHPSEHSGELFVNPENSKALTVGHAGDEAKKEGDYLSATLTITDQKAIDAIKSNTRKEISLGYTCDVENTPGDHQGQRYDAIQRNIIVNHIALGPPGWGRAGPTCAIKMDSNTAIQILKEDQLTEDKANIEKLQGKLDALGQELEAERKLRQDAEDPKQIETQVKQRLDLLTKCQPYLDADNLTKLDDRSLKESVIQKINADLELTGRNNSYVDGVFEALLKIKSTRNDALEKTRAATESKLDTSLSASETARQKLISNMQKLWEQPLCN